MCTLDTNPIIYYTDDEPAAVAALEDLFSQAVPLYVSTITELELFSYPAMTAEEEARIEAFLTAVRIVPVPRPLPASRGTCGACIPASAPLTAPLPPRRSSPTQRS